MSLQTPFSARSTADQVLAGVDLTGKHFVVTGCNSGLGLETMSAIAANGAHVIGLARTLSAAVTACASVSRLCTPVECDLGDFGSVAAAARAIKHLDAPLDAVVANAGIARLPTLETRYGMELQFLVNHLGHFALLNRLSGMVRDGTGRIVIVTDGAGVEQAPSEGIMFDNLDGRQFYRPRTFYGQSKLALALYAKELSRRLLPRGVTVNAVHPGVTKGTRLNRYLQRPLALVASMAGLFARSPQRGAATQTLLAASPRVAGINGEYWTDCQIANGSPLLQNSALGGRLWELSESIVANQTQPSTPALPVAA